MEHKPDGNDLLIVDFLRLPERFSWRRYRIDLVGFLLAWTMVGAFIGFYIWMSTW
jgi:hypothetical protein